MRTIQVDMLTQVDFLEKSGLPHEQAVAVVQCQQAVFENAMLNTLATKSDVSALRLDMADSKLDIVKWVAGMLIAQAALVAALVKLV